jgi:hypothetical protein
MIFSEPEKYLSFLKDNGVIISTEDYGNTNSIPEKVVNENQDWNYINNHFIKHRYAVIDNYLNPEYAERLRKFYLFFNLREDIYDGYDAINFDRKKTKNIWFPLLSNISEESLRLLPFLKNFYFERGWAFIYNNICDGVHLHIDPESVITLNLWVTPETCLNIKKGTNGLHIENLIDIDYAFNRLVIFYSQNLHCSQPVSCLPGHANKRINYTFLYKNY